MKNIKRTLLFVNQYQFGYHIDYAQYCKFLKEDFDITYLCWDYKKAKIEEPGINIMYVSRDGNILIRNIRFIINTVKLLDYQNYNFVFISYFRGSSIISLLNKKKQVLHVDIRTGCVSKNPFARIIYNNLLKFESHFFKSVSVISSGLRDKLKLNNNATILPLGANPIYVNRQKETLHLLYVGILSNRNIEATIEGLKLFLNDNPEIDIHYTIVGEGWNNQKEIFQNRIKQLGIEKHIDLAGYVPHNELIRFFEKANVGVSFIPMTPHFEYQPPTKTFEYLFAGMPVIATQTYENKLVINEHNGILIKDTAESFANGIMELYNSFNSYDENIIRKSVEKYEWRRIIQTMKETILWNI